MRRFILFVSLFTTSLVHLNAMENNQNTVVRIPGKQEPAPLSSRQTNASNPANYHDCLYTPGKQQVEPTATFSSRDRLWHLVQSIDISDEKAFVEAKEIIKNALDRERKLQDAKQQAMESDSYCIDQCSHMHVQFMASRVQLDAVPGAAKHKFSLLGIIKPRATIKVAQ